MVYHLIHEIAVVAHHNNASLKITQILFKHLQSLDIEVICRLVKHQEVGICHKYRAEIETTFLATTEFIDIAVLFFRREKEMLQELRCGEHFAGNRDYLGNILYHIYNLHLFVERQALLAVISPFHGFAHLYDTAIGRRASKQHLDKRRLACTVVSDYTKFLIPGKCIVEILCYDFVSESLGKCLEHEYLVSDIL